MDTYVVMYDNKKENKLVKCWFVINQLMLKTAQVLMYFLSLKTKNRIIRLISKLLIILWVVDWKMSFQFFAFSWNCEMFTVDITCAELDSHSPIG